MKKLIQMGIHMDLGCGVSSNKMEMDEFKKRDMEKEEMWKWNQPESIGVERAKSTIFYLQFTDKVKHLKTVNWGWPFPPWEFGKMHNVFGSGFALKAPDPGDVIKFSTVCLFSTYPFQWLVKGIIWRQHHFSMTFITNTKLVFKDLLSALNVVPWMLASVENSNFKWGHVISIFHVTSPLL